MERAGFVDVRSMDSTIRVSLMYARADNFTGRVLYTDLHEAYLHPKAARALAKAQKILKTSHPELSLKVYDAARPMHIQQKMWNVVAGDCIITVWPWTSRSATRKATRCPWARK